MSEMVDMTENLTLDNNTPRKWEFITNSLRNFRSLGIVSGKEKELIEKLIEYASLIDAVQREHFGNIHTEMWVEIYPKFACRIGEATKDGNMENLFQHIDAFIGGSTCTACEFCFAICKDCPLNQVVCGKHKSEIYWMFKQNIANYSSFDRYKIKASYYYTD